MKCVMCDSNVKEKLVDYKELGKSFGKFKGNVCEKCGEVYFNSETVDRIQQISRKLGFFGIVRKAKVAQLGNSLAIRIPKEIALATGLKKGKEVSIEPKGKSNITIEF
ncbi:MAG: AbrB/MazE/SpoVT family DNA-binding domain-containing protein [Nanoarchaeota archaeon]